MLPMKNQRLWLWLAVLFVFLTACANRGPTYGTGEDAVPDRHLSDSTVAVLGVVSRGKPLQGFRRNSLANDLETSLRIYQPNLGIYPHEHLRRDMERSGVGTVSNAGMHDLLLNRYRINGTLNQEDLDMLREAHGAIRYLVIARIDQDKTIKYEPYASTVRNRRGEVLLDQREMTLMHERAVQVSATTFDLHGGRQVWSGAFASKPVSKRVYTEYVGSSFSGSIASMLSNSFVNGRSSKKHPDAPRSVIAIRETFKSIARDMFGS